ncbi:MAG: hypothetical protein ABSF69_13775 [Polyangiaceae bacterium]|jgi:hypothetical protein
MSSRARNDTKASGPPVDEGPADAGREAEIERMIALGVHPRVARGLRRQPQGDPQAPIPVAASAPDKSRQRS